MNITILNKYNIFFNKRLALYDDTTSILDFILALYEEYPIIYDNDNNVHKAVPLFMYCSWNVMNGKFVSSIATKIKGNKYTIKILTPKNTVLKFKYIGFESLNILTYATIYKENRMTLYNASYSLGQ